jgi:hypothetical protein
MAPLEESGFIGSGQFAAHLKAIASPFFDLTVDLFGSKAGAVVSNFVAPKERISIAGAPAAPGDVLGALLRPPSSTSCSTQEGRRAARGWA